MRDAEADLASIYNALAESVLEMSDEEIEAEIRDEGLDPGEVAAHVRQVMREAIKPKEIVDMEHCAIHSISYFIDCGACTRLLPAGTIGNHATCNDCEQLKSFFCETCGSCRGCCRCADFEGEESDE